MPLKRSQSAVLVYRKELDTPALLPVARTRWQCSYLGHFIAISVQWEKVEMVYLSSDRYEIQNVLNVFFFLFFSFFLFTYFKTSKSILFYSLVLSHLCVVRNEVSLCAVFAQNPR